MTINRSISTRRPRTALAHLAHEYRVMASLPLSVHADVLRALLSVTVVRLAQARGPVTRPVPASRTFARFHAAVERDHAVTRRVEDHGEAGPPGSRRGPA
ncbi:hypothetical protein HCJ99_32570, partial [Streptomyces sp. C1-2]|nr:hypothetical protein [Streptomyces sp. C1-2]